MPVLNVTSFWLFAIATSIFSALNERELRLRRADLQSLVDVGTKLDSVADAVQQSDIVLQALVGRFGFPRGLLLGESDGRVVVLATHGIPPAPTTATDADWIVRRAWERRDILPVKQLDPARDPFLAALLPGREERPRRPDDRRRPHARRDRRRASDAVEPASSGGSPRCSASSPRSRP